MSPLASWVPLSLVTITTVAAVTDWRTGKIPNWLTLSPLLLGPLAHGSMGGAQGLALSLGGALVCGVVPALLYRASRGEAIGGGDLKLFAAIGALAGPTQGIEIELASFVLMAVLACTRLTFEGKLGRVLLNALLILCGPVLPRRFRRPVAPEALTALRLGPFIALATLMLVALDLPELWL